MSKLFNLLNLFSNHNKKDVKIFLTMSSNRLPDLDQKIIKDLLEISQVKKGKEVSILSKYFGYISSNKEAKQAWARTKYRLSEALENFIVLQKLKKHPIRELILLNFYKENKLSLQKDRLLKSMKKKLTAQKEDHTSLYEYLVADFVINNQDKIRVVSKGFESMERRLDYFFLEKKIRCLCERNNREQIINSPLKSDQQLLDWIETQMQDCDSLTTNLYYLCFKMISLNDDQFYFKAKYLIYQNIANIDNLAISEIIHYLLNYCTQYVNKGNSSFAMDYLMLIDQLKTYHLLLDHQSLNAVKFKNCINIALIANKIEWAKNFCDSYSEFIPQEHRKGILSLCQANIAFYESDYEGCIKILGQHEFKDPFHRLAYHLIGLKVDCIEVLNKRFDLIAFIAKVKNRRDFIRKQDWIKDNRKEKLQYTLSLLTKIARGKANNLKIKKDKLYTLDWIWISELLKQN